MINECVYCEQGIFVIINKKLYGIGINNLGLVSHIVEITDDFDEDELKEIQEEMKSKYEGNLVDEVFEKLLKPFKKDREIVMKRMLLKNKGVR